MFVWKDENKGKRGRGWPTFKKTNDLCKAAAERLAEV